MLIFFEVIKLSCILLMKSTFEGQTSHYREYGLHCGFVVFLEGESSVKVERNLIAIQPPTQNAH